MANGNGCSTVNVWSLVQNIAMFPAQDPGWADLSIGYSYALFIYNGTAEDIVDGVIGFEGACPSADDPCVPGDFVPLDPVAGCSDIVSGVPEPGPVTVTLSEERPIRAHGMCGFAVPCPLPFFRVTGVPDGCFACVVVSNLKRTDWSHTGPYGYIPPPLQQPFQLGFQSPLPLAAPQHAGAQPQRAYAPQPQPRATHQ